MLKEIVISFQAYAQAHQFILKHRLWKWIVIPGLIYMLLFCLSMYYFWHSSNSFIDWFNNFTGLRDWVQQRQSEVLGFLFLLTSLVLSFIIFVFYLSLFKFFWLIVGSPIFSYLSEKTESIIEGKNYNFNIKQLLKDMLRGVKLALRNLLWQNVYTISILLLSLIPLVGWITPIFVLLIEFYYNGFSMLDYSMERHKKSPAESIFYIGSHKGLAIGNGLIFYLMHLVPVIGWMFAPAYAVVAATLSLYPLKNKN